MCFAISILLSTGCFAGLIKYANDLLFTQDQIVLIREPDLGSRILSEKYPIAFFHVEWNVEAVLEKPATSKRHYFSLL